MQAIALRTSATQELGKFLTLFAEGVQNLVMPSKLIDQTWHSLYESSDYGDFCNEHAGSFVTHIEDEGQGLVEWTKVYEKKYGSLHPVWFMDEQGNLDESNYHHYLQTGNWERASWRCKPGK